MEARGTLAKHRDMWRIIITYYDQDGKRRQKTYSTGLSVTGNKRKAEQMMKERLSEFEQESTDPKKEMTVSEWVEYYLDRKKMEIRNISYYRYCTNYNKYIKDYFKNIKLKNLESLDIDAFYKHLSQSVGQSTIRLIITPLKQAIKYAYTINIIKTDPCRDVQIYKSPPKVKQHKHIYTQDEINNLLQKLKPEKIYPIILLTVLYGLRREEVLGLLWDDIDFENRLIYIRHSLIKMNHCKAELRDYCKTDSSVRICTMTENVYHLLKQIKTLQEMYKQKFKDKYIYYEHDYVFTKYNGSIYAPNGLTCSFNHFLKKNNLPVARFHDLRHTAATLLFDSGMTVKQVQHQLGHSNASTTIDVYIHTLDERNKETAAAMDEIIKI